MGLCVQDCYPEWSFAIGIVSFMSQGPVHLDPKFHAWKPLLPRCQIDFSAKFLRAQ